jgi:hypothetical protein
VTQSIRAERWLRGFDDDLASHLVTGTQFTCFTSTRVQILTRLRRAEYKEQGIDIKFNSNIKKMEKVAANISVTA